MGIVLFIAMIVIVIIATVVLRKNPKKILAILGLGIMLYIIAAHIAYAAFTVDAPGRLENLDIITLGQTTFYVRETDKSYVYSINEELLEIPKTNVTLRVRGLDQIPQITVYEAEVRKSFWTSGWIYKPDLKKEVIIEVPGGFVDYNE